MVVILVNVVFIFMLYFLGWRYNEWLELIDYVFIFFFFLEVVVKFYMFKLCYYFVDFWNCFDLIIVLGSLFFLLVQVIFVFDILLLIILCLFCLICLICFICFVLYLSKVIIGLGWVLQALFFVLLVLLFFNLLLVIFICYFFVDVVLQYFGDFFIVFYFIFQMFIVEGWNEILAMIV